MDTDQRMKKQEAVGTLLVTGEPTDARRLLHPRREAAWLLGISLRKLDELIASKVLPVRRIGKRVLIPHRTLEAFARRDHPTQADGSKGDLR